MTIRRPSTFRLHQVRCTRAFGQVRITAIARRDGETVIHAKTLDDAHALTLSARYCARLPVPSHAGA